MMRLQRDNNQQPEAIAPEIIQAKLDIISLANETGVLMALLMDKLGLPQKTTTHQQFVEAFTNMQKERLEAEKFMQEQFMLGQEIKTRKKREKKEESEDVQ